MDINYNNNLHDDSGYRIRCMRSLAEQLKKDYADLNLLLKGLNNDACDILAEDEVMQRLSWIKEELKLFNKFTMMNIEGVLWGEIEQIEKDVMQIETILNGRILFW